MTSPLKLLHCKNCNEPFPVQGLNSGTLDHCPKCEKPVEGYVYPAIFKQTETSSSETVSEETEASCFFHPSKKASVVCDECGLFICSLCDIPLQDKHLCPQCIEKGQTKGKIKNLQNKRVLYDDIAISLSIIPFLFWPLTIITGPTTLFICFRYWKSEKSLIRKGKSRFVIAGLIAFLQTGGWALGIAYFISTLFHA